MRYDPLCCGCAKGTFMTWKQFREHNHHFDRHAPVINVTDTVMCFLQQRVGPDRRPMSDSVLQFTRYNHNWVRLAIEPPEILAQLELNGKERGMARAFHGTRFQCLYSILFGRQLIPGPEAPGVYMYSLMNRHKAERWMNLAELRDDGVYYGVLVEAIVDTNKQIKQRGSNQIIQLPGSVHIVAVWVCARHWTGLNDDDFVQSTWSPEREVAPIPYQEPQIAPPRLSGGSAAAAFDPTFTQPLRELLMPHSSQPVPAPCMAFPWPPPPPNQTAQAAAAGFASCDSLSEGHTPLLPHRPESAAASQPPPLEQLLAQGGTAVSAHQSWGQDGTGQKPAYGQDHTGQSQPAVKKPPPPPPLPPPCPPPGQLAVPAKPQAAAKKKPPSPPPPAFFRANPGALLPQPCPPPGKPAVPAAKKPPPPPPCLTPGQLAVPAKPPAAAKKPPPPPPCLTPGQLAVPAKPPAARPVSSGAAEPEKVTPADPGIQQTTVVSEAIPADTRITAGWACPTGTARGDGTLSLGPKPCCCSHRFAAW